MADQPHRRKVALLWNPHDVLGVSTYPAFTANEKSWLSLAVLSEEAPLG